MKTVTFYKYNGEIVETVEMDAGSIIDCNGMKVRCTMLDGSERVGFANPHYSMEEGKFIYRKKTDVIDYLVLAVFVNIDEENHRLIGDEYSRYDMKREAVPITEIDHIDAILYSAIRWGTLPTNKFFFKNEKLD